MEERLRDNSIGLVLVNWSPSQLELGEVPRILEARECLRVVEELSRLAMDNFGVWSLRPARLKRLRFAVGQGDQAGIADILRQPRRGLFTAGLFGDRFAAGARDVCRGFPRMLRLLSRPGFRSVQGREVEAGAEVPAGGMGRVDLERGAETPDALERNLLYLLASWNGALHPALLQLAHDVADRSGPDCGGVPRGLPEEQLKPLLALSNQVRGIIREIDSRRTKRN